MKKIIVCVKHRASPHQPSCAAKGSEQMAQMIEQMIAANDLQLAVERFKCLGCCEDGMNIKLVPEGPFLHGLRLENLDEMMASLQAFARSDS